VATPGMFLARVAAVRPVFASGRKHNACPGRGAVKLGRLIWIGTAI
jgi:hypothetical protein